LRRKNIIIVDDELLIRDLLYDFFSEKDWGVSVFDTGEKALEAVKNRRYDICLVDLKMPEIDGLSFIKKLRNSHPTMPVVIMTAFPTVETAIDALRLKVDDYIIKPFNINKLFKTLDSFVEQKRKLIEAVEAEDFQL
jgi:DNA-binding response OmpR family regulator